jgi:hypothetical protein
MGIRVGFGRVGGLALLMAASVAISGFPTSRAGATAEPGPPDGSSGPAGIASRVAGTWGACGSWWTETPTRSESGSVCGVDGVVTDNGQPTQLAEPVIQVSRYVCLKRKQRFSDCSSESFSGTVRRSEMTVDPFLRRATIRGVLGGCALDVEFAGLGPAQPQGNLWESYGLVGGTPTISVGGSHTFTSQASWWGGVCGQTVAPMTQEQGQGWLFRGAEANLSGFGGAGGEGHGEGEG